MEKQWESWGLGLMGEGDEGLVRLLSDGRFGGDRKIILMVLTFESK